MKKIFLITLMLILFTTSVIALNNKNIKSPPQFDGLFAEHTVVPTNCDLAVSTDSDLKTLEFENKYYAVVPIKNQKSQIVIIDSSDSGCSIIDSINTNFELSSELETFDNKVLFHTENSVLQVYEFNGTDLNYLDSSTFPIALEVYDSLTDDNETDGIAESISGVIGETSSNIFNSSHLIYGFNGEVNQLEIFYDSEDGTPDNGNYNFSVAICESSSTDLTADHNDCDSAETIVANNLNATALFGNKNSGENIIIDFNVNEYNFSSSTNYIIKFIYDSGTLQSGNHYYLIQADQDAIISKRYKVVKDGGDYLVSKIIKIKFNYFENSSALINHSLSNNSITCGEIYDNTDKCFILDNYDGLNIIDITNKSDILFSRYALTDDSQIFDLENIRRPILTNLDDTEIDKIKTLVYRYDPNQNGEDGYRSIDLSSYNEHTWGHIDDIVDSSTGCNHLSNPLAYCNAIAGDCLPKIYAFRITKGDVSNCDGEILQFQNNETYSVKSELTSVSSGNVYASDFFEMQDIRDTPDICVIHHFEPSQFRDAFVCYNIADDLEISPVKVNPSKWMEGWFFDANRKLYPAVSQVYNQTDGLHSDFLYILDTEDDINNLYVPYFYWGEQRRLSTSLVPESLRPYYEGYKYLHHLSTKYPNNFTDIENNYLLNTTNIENVNLGTINYNQNSYAIAYYVEDLNNDGLADYVYTYDENTLRFAYSGYDNQPPSIVSIKINSDSSTLCNNRTYTFSTAYVDIENNPVYYSYKCGDDSVYSNYSTTTTLSPVNIDCSTSEIGLKEFSIKIKGLYSEDTEDAYKVEYEVIDDVPPSCALPDSGTTNLTIIETTENSQLSVSPTFGLNEFASSLGWGQTNKNLAVIIIVIVISIAGLYYSRDNEGETSPMALFITGIIDIALIYFFYKIAWVTGFFLFLIGLISSAFIMYLIFGRRGN